MNSCFLLKIGQGSDKMTLFLFCTCIEIESWKCSGKCQFASDSDSRCQNLLLVKAFGQH